MTVFGLIWLVLMLAVLGYEFYAIASKRRGDTLSEQVWGLARHSRAFVGILSALLAWLGWHFIIEPRFFPGLHISEFTDDIVLVLVTSGLGAWAGPIKNAGRPG